VFWFDRNLKSKNKEKREMELCLIHPYKPKVLLYIYICLYFPSRSFLTKAHVACLNLSGHCLSAGRKRSYLLVMVFHCPIFVSTHTTSLYTLERLVWVLNVVHCCQLHLQSSAEWPVEYIPGGIIYIYIL